MQITLPPGALLAAERAYNNLSPGQRRDSGQVAEAILRAAAPFMAPAVAQLGRCRITPTGATDILRRWLSGMSTNDLAAYYAVSAQTINRYIRRGLDRVRVRVDAGVPLSVIAAENQVPSTALRAALDMEVRRGA